MDFPDRRSLSTSIISSDFKNNTVSYWFPRDKNMKKLRELYCNGMCVIVFNDGYWADCRYISFGYVDNNMKNVNNVYCKDRVIEFDME